MTTPQYLSYPNIKKMSPANILKKAEELFNAKDYGAALYYCGFAVAAGRVILDIQKSGKLEATPSSAAQAHYTKAENILRSLISTINPAITYNSDGSCEDSSCKNLHDVLNEHQSLKCPDLDHLDLDQLLKTTIPEVQRLDPRFDPQKSDLPDFQRRGPSLPSLEEHRNRYNTLVSKYGKMYHLNGTNVLLNCGIIKTFFKIF